MRRKNNFIYALLLISIALVSCEDYLNVNRSKDNITTVTPELILPVLRFIR